jgi:HPt (histidine-containing phosphotransfer) domain-containing protein
VITDGDPAVERRLLTVFRKANDADAAALEEALARRDIAAITRASHGMMGASRLVGAAVLADICATIAQAGQAGDWGTIAANQHALARELDRVTAYIDTLLATARSGIIKPEP